MSEGFNVVHAALVPRITPLPEGLMGWLAVFARNSILKDLSEEEALSIMKQVESMCSVDCLDEDGNWTVVYIRLRFVAIKP